MWLRQIQFSKVLPSSFHREIGHRPHPLLGATKVTKRNDSLFMSLYRPSARGRASQQAVVEHRAEASEESEPTHIAEFVIHNARKDMRVSVKFVSRDDPKLYTQEYLIQESRQDSHDKNHQEEDAETGQYKCSHNLPIHLPTGFQPGVLLVNKHEDKADYHIYISKADIVSFEDENRVSYVVESNVDASQGWRPFFPDYEVLPGFLNETPLGLKGFREDELHAIQGTSTENTMPRTGADRIYGFDVYNDLGSATDESKMRPTLGGGELKYPRRLRTGREQIDGREVAPEKGDLPWLPLDERFNSVKFNQFQEGAQEAGGLAFRAILGTPRGYSFLLSLIPFIKAKVSTNKKGEKDSIFKSFGVVDSMYDGLTGPNKVSSTEMKHLLPLHALSDRELLVELKNVKMDRGLQEAIGLGRDADPVNDAIQKRIDEMGKDDGAKPQAKNHGLFDFLHGLLDFLPWKKDEKENPDYKDVDGKPKFSWKTPIETVARIYKSFLEQWPPPGARFGRALEWRSDEEFARSALAGQNPISIRAVTSDDLNKFSVRDEDVKGLLDDNNLAKALKEKRLFCLDFHPGYDKYIQKVADLRNGVSKLFGDKKIDFDGVLYAGRCLFYKRKSGTLMPVSIELETDGQAMRVYTPSKDPPEIWFLAKAVIASLDSGIHQLISHWLTTHACVEAFAISTKRELSILNPLYKLLWPHFRYTLRINCNARASLISAGGIIETAFSPGPFSMELSAKVYEGWRFEHQSFPADLEHRGMAKEIGGGKLDIFVDDYAYAEDGIRVWNAILKFAQNYLKLYYDDNKKGKRVTDDLEIKEWWRSIKEEGHPDTKEGWPELKTVGDLAYIAATIMWTASAHHAAVNFGQYDNAAYMPYKPSKIRKKIPEIDSHEEGILRNCFEEEFLNIVSDPLSTMLVMATVQILSAHASDEEYLDRSDHKFIKDARGKQVHDQFVKELKDAEVKMAERNEASAKKCRRAKDYTLLMPSNPQRDPDPTEPPPPRGIPYSISI